MPNTNTRKFTSGTQSFTADITHDNVENDQECAENYTIWKLQIQARLGKLDDYKDNAENIKCDVYGNTYVSTEQLIAKMTPEQRADHKRAILAIEKAEREEAKKAA